GISGGNSNVGTINTSGVYVAPSSVSGQTSFTITATSAADPSKSGSAVATIYPPVTCTYGASPSTVVVPGHTLLSWNCAYAGSCTLDGAPVGTTGNKTEYPTSTTSYDLQCTSAVNGSASFDGSILVTVHNPGIKETNP